MTHTNSHQPWFQHILKFYLALSCPNLLKSLDDQTNALFQNFWYNQARMYNLTKQSTTWLSKIGSRNDSLPYLSHSYTDISCLYEVMYDVIKGQACAKLPSIPLASFVHIDDLQDQSVLNDPKRGKKGPMAMVKLVACSFQLNCHHQMA